jgi:ABC-type transporter Mla maintaining outer membrane lipid asymmetry permease subunit MlaE
VINIVLTVTDQVGLWDVLTGVLDLVLLGLVIAIRGHYHGPSA